MTLSTGALPLDLTGKAESNYCKGIPVRIAGPRDRVIAFMNGPFYEDDLIITEVATGRVLEREDYELLSYQRDVSKRTDGLSAFGLMVISKKVEAIDFYVDAHFVGGEYESNIRTFVEVIKGLSNDERVSVFSDLLGNDIDQIAAPHAHDVGDAWGYQYMTNILADIREHFLELSRVDDNEFIDLVKQFEKELTKQANAHISDRGNPHDTNCDDLNLYWHQQIVDKFKAITVKLEDKATPIKANLNLSEKYRHAFEAAGERITYFNNKISVMNADLDSMLLQIDDTNQDIAALKAAIIVVSETFRQLELKDQQLTALHDSLAAIMTDLENENTIIQNRINAAVSDNTALNTLFNNLSNDVTAYQARTYELIQALTQRVESYRLRILQLGNEVYAAETIQNALIAKINHHHGAIHDAIDAAINKFIRAYDPAVLQMQGLAANMAGGHVDVYGEESGGVFQTAGTNSSYVICTFGVYPERPNQAGLANTGIRALSGFFPMQTGARVLDWPDGSPAVGFLFVGDPNGSGRIDVVMDTTFNGYLIKAVTATLK